MFFVVFNEDGIIDSFSVTSDFDRNKVLYRIPLDAWIAYMDYIASDDIVGMSSHYDPKANDYVFQPHRTWKTIGYKLCTLVFRRENGFIKLLRQN